MFNKETLQHIEAQALIASGTRIEVPGGTTLAVLPEAARTLNLEQYQELRNRFRGDLKTHSLRDFCNYVTNHVDDLSAAGPSGFINQDNMSAQVLFNLGNPDTAGHADDTATLTLKPTAAFKAVEAIVGQKLSQQALAEWLEDWARNIEASAGEAKLNIVAAINGIRRMTIKATSQRDSSVGDLSASRSAMDEIEAKSQETLPTSFHFTTVPYEGLQPALIVLRLSVITGNDAPVLKLRWVGEEAQREEFAEEFKNVLSSEIGGLVPLTIGTFQLGK
ncbi:YfdQ family protein [Pseudomonas fulva]|uniref:YfdQ family protein n=1 Tax=Pseudomonas fulva TaxID=47880 RepID=UPI00201E2110|nr:YfdQ family protein [Pseudomonas fulva]UQY33792.1 YfdQ family protein [Pseudomonas fulva]